MGVDKTTYLLIGIKFDYDELDEEVIWSDAILPYVEGHQSVDFRLITDGMGGEYHFFGKVLASTSDWDDVVQPITISEEEQIEIAFRVIVEAEKLFGVKKPANLWFFNHYS